MTANHAHTPTTEVVKDAACFPRDRLGEPRGIDTDAFDRWLAEIEAAAEQHGAERELFELSTHLMKSEFPAGHHAGIQTVLHEIDRRLAVMEEYSPEG